VLTLKKKARASTWTKHNALEAGAQSGKTPEMKATWGWRDCRVRWEGGISHRTKSRLKAGEIKRGGGDFGIVDNKWARVGLLRNHCVPSVINEPGV